MFAPGYPSTPLRFAQDKRPARMRLFASGRLEPLGGSDRGEILGANVPRVAVADRIPAVVEPVPVVVAGPVPPARPDVGGAGIPDRHVLRHRGAETLGAGPRLGIAVLADMPDPARPGADRAVLLRR